MHRPFGLAFEQDIQGRFEAILPPCGLEDAHYLVRTFVQWRIAEHQAQIVRVPFQHLVEDGVEGTARLAGRIEELNERHRRVGVPDDRRMRAHELVAAGGQGAASGWLRR